MPQLLKVNHIAYLTDNIPATLHFYIEVLGMQLIAAERRLVRPSDLDSPLDWKPDFVFENETTEQITIMLEMLDGSRIAFLEVAGLTRRRPNPLSGPLIRHMAMKVNTIEELQKAKAVLQAEGIKVLGITDHGLFRSIYFSDPINDIRLEYACNVGELTEADSQAAWEALQVWQTGGIPANRTIH